jgi:DNA-dependent RNA polymerase auxiliary subunit epsilon
MNPLKKLTDQEKQSLKYWCVGTTSHSRKSVGENYFYAKDIAEVRAIMKKKKLPIHYIEEIDKPVDYPVETKQLNFTSIPYKREEDEDDWGGFNRDRRKWEKEARDKHVRTALEHLDKYQYPYSETKTPNVVLINYYHAEHRLSLSTFKLFNGYKWIQKKRITLTPQTTLKFGKYVGRKLSEINDFNYIKWLLCNTNLMIHPDVFR